jgi:hypothetical protein
VRSSLAILLLAALLGCYQPGRGYIESEFDLVLDSRFPKFFDAPVGASPRDYKARVTYYSSPSVRVVIRDRAGRTVFDQQGAVRWHPLDDKEQHPAGHYPNHTVVSFGDRVDIFEQRQPEPLEYLSDDKVLWDAIGKGT